MTLVNAKARAKLTFIVQASLTIITYHQNIFTAKATGENCRKRFLKVLKFRGRIHNTSSSS
jgi:hypothetical protein